MERFDPNRPYAHSNEAITYEEELEYNARAAQSNPALAARSVILLDMVHQCTDQIEIALAHYAISRGYQPKVVGGTDEAPQHEDPMEFLTRVVDDVSARLRDGEEAAEPWTWFIHLFNINLAVHANVCVPLKVARKHMAEEQAKYEANPELYEQNANKAQGSGPTPEPPSDPRLN